MKKDNCPRCGGIAMKKIKKIFSLKFLRCESCGQKLRISILYNFSAVTVIMVLAILLSESLDIGPFITIAISLLIYLPFVYFMPLEVRYGEQSEKHAAVSKPIAIEIRAAVASDAPALSRISMTSVAPFKDSDFSQAGWENFLLANSAESTLTRLTSARYQCFCYTQEGEILGFITISDFQKIDQLFVLPKAQRKGVARALWEKIRTQGLTLNNPLRLSVRSSTTAVPVYRRFGFIEDGEPQVENGIQYQLMRFEYPAPK